MKKKMSQFNNAKSVNYSNIISEKIVTLGYVACENICFSSLLPLGMFRVEERLLLSDRNSILMMQINVYIINPVVLWSILEKCCVHLPMSSRKTQMPLLEKTIFHKH